MLLSPIDVWMLCEVFLEAAIEVRRDHLAPNRLLTAHANTMSPLRTAITRIKIRITNILFNHVPECLMRSSKYRIDGARNRERIPPRWSGFIIDESEPELLHPVTILIHERPEGPIFFRSDPSRIQVYLPLFVSDLSMNRDKVMSIPQPIPISRNQRLQSVLDGLHPQHCVRGHETQTVFLVLLHIQQLSQHPMQCGGRPCHIRDAAFPLSELAQTDPRHGSFVSGHSPQWEAKRYLSRL